MRLELTGRHVTISPAVRKAVERRLARLGRNSMLLATAVQHRADSLGGRVFFGARYPGLATHPASSWTGAGWFRGGFFEVAFADGSDSIERERRFVDIVLQEARARSVPLAAGASFGLGTTRIYHTASTSAHGEPFVRIAPGTEHRLEVEAVAGVLLTAMARLELEAGGPGARRVQAGGPQAGGLPRFRVGS